jgi:hypothetical protein
MGAKLLGEMRTHRQRSRCLTSLLLVMASLFSQLALASYVCPGLSAEVRMDERMASGLPCDGDDPSMPVLCHQYAADASQSFEIAKVAAPSLPTVVQMFILPSLLDWARPLVVPFGERPEAQPPPDPLFLQTLRLRF